MGCLKGVLLEEHNPQSSILPADSEPSTTPQKPYNFGNVALHTLATVMGFSLSTIFDDPVAKAVCATTATFMLNMLASDYHGHAQVKDMFDIKKLGHMVGQISTLGMAFVMSTTSQDGHDNNNWREAYAANQKRITVQEQQDSAAIVPEQQKASMLPILFQPSAP